MFDGARRAILMVFAVLALSAGSIASAHENHDAIGAGPGPAKNATPNQRADKADATDGHVGMGSMSTVDMNLGGRGIAGDDMDMGGMHEEAANKNKTFGQRIVSWLGRLHTMVIHFPIAMFIGAFAVELFGLWRRNRDMQHVAHVMLVVGALGAIVAAFLGWFAGGYLAAGHRRAPERSRKLYLVLLGLMTLAISVQGFLGGTFMHGGLNHLAF